VETRAIANVGRIVEGTSLGKGGPPVRSRTPFADNFPLFLLKALANNPALDNQNAQAKAVARGCSVERMIRS
jgi:hypothetical protein